MLIQNLIYLYLETKLIIVFQDIILHTDIIVCFLELHFQCISISKRIKNIYIDIELVLPMYNVHPYFFLKNLDRKVCIIHSKIW